MAVAITLNGAACPGTPKAIYFTAGSVSSTYGRYCDKLQTKATITVGELKARFGEGAGDLDLLEDKPDNTEIEVSGELLISLWVLPKDGAQRLWLIQERDNTPNA